MRTWNLLLSTISLILLIPADCSLSVTSYQLMTDASYGASSLGPSWTSGTALACVRTCLLLYGACYSFVYNSGQCTPGSKLTYGTSRPASGGKFYYTDYCDTTRGYRLYVYKSVVQCLYVTNTSGTFDQGRVDCAARDGRVMMAKTIDKFNLFLSIAKNVFKTFTFLGLSDLVTEGTFLWEDGEPLNDTYKTQIFLPGEPNADTSLSDCSIASAFGNFAGLFDGRCDLGANPSPRYYICEPLIN
ncbi:uncharacterized protein LOC131954777 [Physella acuta]|uniref:uncharacterized protein LOC131954777 n=1 Tax=Physella acuta TaxID=109671 RepID=UPI0027DC1F9D|nr:uncharacterized protein LOC131954777 [Physella acuta]